MPTDLYLEDPLSHFPPGTYVRSFDFPGHWDCYVEGVIEGNGGDVFPSDVHYRLRVVKRVWEGRAVPIPSRELVLYPPIRGSFGRRLVYRLAPPVQYACLHCGSAVVADREGLVQHACT